MLVVGPGDTLAYRPIVPGRLTDGLRIVTSGLKPGERIVVNGLHAGTARHEGHSDARGDGA